MTRRLRLRRWQRDALDALAGTRDPDFMAVATPGAGKTTFGLVAMLHHLREHPAARLVVVTPSRSLKAQWAAAAARLGLDLVADWDGGALPADAHGVVVTYAQVGARPADVARVAAGGGALIDEIHHAGAERTWGDGLLAGLGAAGLRVALSGTLWRGDQNPIPFVRYDADGTACPDFRYGYEQALRDGGVVRPAFFASLGGSMEWIGHDGSANAASFDDPLDAQGRSQRLRTALAADGGWLRDALTQAHRRLLDLRADDPDAGGIVFAMDQEHARAVAAVLAEVSGTRPVLAISDEPDAHRRLATFAHSTTPWAVCVRYASEGYDAPRLRVGVYATNVVAPLFWAQALGRIVRWRPQSGPRQSAWMYLPADPRLRELAASLRTLRVHSLRQREDDVDDPLDERDEVAADADQLSLFAAVSSRADGEVREHGPLALDTVEDLPVHGLALDDGDPSLEVDLPPPPRGRAATANGDGGHDRVTLRRANSHRVTTIARLSGLGHREINARLNKTVGITKITTATVPQLQRRVAEADRWIARL